MRYLILAMQTFFVFIIIPVDKNLSINTCKIEY
jgi:hypothetical protein